MTYFTKRNDRMTWTPKYPQLWERIVFLASVSLSRVYISSSQISQVPSILLWRDCNEQKQQKEYDSICRFRDFCIMNRTEAIIGVPWEIKENPIVTSISMERITNISRSEVKNRLSFHLCRYSLHNWRLTLLLSQSYHRPFFGRKIRCFYYFSSCQT